MKRCAPFKTHPEHEDAKDALQSQAPRSGGTRRYASNSRRKKGLGPWLALLGLVVIVAGLIVLFSDPEDPTTPANANAASPEQAGPEITGPSTETQLPPDRVTPPAVTDEGTPDRDTDTGGAASRPDPRLESIATSETQQLIGAAKDQYETGMQRLESGDIPVGRALLSELLFREVHCPGTRHKPSANAWPF